MAKINGKLIFLECHELQTYEDFGMPLNSITSVIINHEYAKQVYANASWNTIGDKKRKKLN